MAFFSSAAPLQDDNTTASARLAVVRSRGDFEFTFVGSIGLPEIPPGDSGAGLLPAAADEETEGGQGQTCGRSARGSAVQPPLAAAPGCTFTVSAAVEVPTPG